MHCNVTMWRGRVTTVAVEKRQYILCFCALPYKWQECWETITDDKICVLIFSTTFV
jgi:hypothetical protein